MANKKDAHFLQKEEAFEVITNVCICRDVWLGFVCGQAIFVFVLDKI